MDQSEKFLKLKKEIEDAKIEKATLKGRLKTSMEQLKDEFDVNSIEEAEEHLEKLKKELIDVQKQIQENEEELEEIFE